MITCVFLLLDSELMINFLLPTILQDPRVSFHHEDEPYPNEEHLTKSLYQRQITNRKLKGQKQRQQNENKRSAAAKAIECSALSEHKKARNTESSQKQKDRGKMTMKDKHDEEQRK